jgi:hypothetical protein
LAKNPSTALSQDAEVGVKWKVQRGVRTGTHLTGDQVLAKVALRYFSAEDRVLLQRMRMGVRKDSTNLSNATWVKMSAKSYEVL